MPYQLLKENTHFQSLWEWIPGPEWKFPEEMLSPNNEFRRLETTSDIYIRGKPEGFGVNPKDEADAPKAEQKVENTWDSSDIEFLV